MANVVESLFGMSPQDVRAQQSSQINDAAIQFANMDPFQRANASLFNAGAGLGRLGADYAGMPNPAVEEAQQRQAMFGDANMGTPDGVYAMAEKLRGTDPQRSFMLMQLGQQMEAQQAENDYRRAQAAKYQAEADAKGAPEDELKYAPDIVRLMAWRDRFPEGSPQRAQIDAAIAMKVNPPVGKGSRGGAAAGAATPKPTKITKGQEAVDRTFGKDYAEYVAGGGFADVQKSISQLDRVLKELETPGNDYTGPLVGVMPDKMRAITNPNAVDAKNQVEEVVQRNLRLVLGAQFTEKEGERLIARAYNPQLEPAQNARRVRALVNQIKTAAESKEDAARYFEEHGSLVGWKGKMPTINDFYNALSGGKTRGASSGVPAFPNEAAAAAAGLKPGTRVIINGVSGVWE